MSDVVEIKGYTKRFASRLHSLSYFSFDCFASMIVFSGSFVCKRSNERRMLMRSRSELMQGELFLSSVLECFIRLFGRELCCLMVFE